MGVNDKPSYLNKASFPNWVRYRTMQGADDQPSTWWGRLWNGWRNLSVTTC